MSLLELRQTTDGTLVLTGYASTFGTWYPVSDSAGRYQERVLSGAFARSLRERPDVVLTAQHGKGLSGLPIARTTSGTLNLREDSVGLAIRATLDPTDPDVQTIRPKIARGDLSQMSFAFRCYPDGQRWDTSDAEARRELTAVDVNGGDVTITDRPCNPSTSIALGDSETSEMEVGRSLREHVGLEVRGHSPAGIVVAEARASKYSAQELKEFMRKGWAMPNARGEPSFPVVDRDDLARAIKAVVRSTRDPRHVRLHIMKNARRLGATDLIPDSWNLDGSTRSLKIVSTVQLRRELGLPRSARLRLQ